MKNKFADIDEILAKSQRLTTHSGLNGSSPSGRHAARGVAELTEFSKQWNKETTNGQSNLDAFRLLSQKNFDAKKLFEDVSSIQVKSADDSAMRLEGTDIEGYLAHQHDMIILTAIEEAKQGAEDHVQEMQRRWAASEWSLARHKFMESLGHRAYRWEGTTGPTPAKANGGPFNTPFTPHREGFSQRHDIFSPSSKRNVVGSSSTARTPFGSSVASLDTRPPFSELVSNQSRVLRGLNLSSHTSSQTRTATGALLSGEVPPAPGSVKPFLQLATGVRVPDQGTGRTIVSDGLNKADMIAYKAHLQLLASAVGESNVQRTSATSEREALIRYSATRQVPATFISAPGETGVPPAGYFSGLCLDPTDFAHSSASSQFQAMEDRRQWLTVGTKSYLEVQYWDVLSHSLDEAVSREGWQIQSSAEGASRQQKLRSYVAYLHHSRQTPSQCAKVLSSTSAVAGDSSAPLTPSLRGMRSTSSTSSVSGQTTTPLWVFIYHCCRVGDITAAVAELSSCLSRGHLEGGAAALTVLQTLQQLFTPVGSSGRNSQSARTPRAGALPEHEVRAMIDAMLQCRAQYQRETAADENVCDPYRLLVFNLLGLANKEDLACNALPRFSLEDFLWSHLWFIQAVRVLHPVLGSSAFPTPLAASERKLFEMVLEYGGPDYFDEDRTNPFRYAMVLCCCLRYGDAIAHLWQCNKVVPAVHLTCTALHYGLVLPHVPLDMNPSHPMVMGGRFVNGSAYATTQDPTPTSILQFFTATPTMQSYPEVVTDYLVSLDSNWLTHAQGLDAELKETLKLKSQAVVSGVLENFISSLSREQLCEVVGEPSDGRMDGPAAVARGVARTMGRLDDYLNTTQVELLLARSAYNMLTQRKEAEAAVYLYLLAGRYSEVVEEICTQLAAVLVTPTDARASQAAEVARMQWHTLAENFVDRYLQGQSLVLHTLTQTGGRALVDSLLLLTNLFVYVDAVRSGEVSSIEALRKLDQLQLLPASVQQLDLYVSFSHFLESTMDDLLVMTMECTLRAYQEAQLQRSHQTSTTSGAGNFSGLNTEWDLQMEALKQRATALASFAQKIKHRLTRHDTVSMLARMEASIV